MSNELKENQIFVVRHSLAPKFSDQWFKEIIKIAAFQASKPARSLNIILVGDKEMRKLNFVYRGLNKPTDVLSFRAEEKTGSEWPSKKEAIDQSFYLGEIILNIPCLQRHAKEYGVMFNTEVARMAIHGFLHLWGYDHIKRSDAKKMMPLQDKILSDIFKKV